MSSTPLGVFTDVELADLRAYIADMDAHGIASERLDWAEHGPRLLATIAARDAEIERLRKQVRGMQCGIHRDVHAEADRCIPCALSAARDRAEAAERALAEKEPVIEDLIARAVLAEAEVARLKAEPGYRDLLARCEEWRKRAGDAERGREWARHCLQRIAEREMHAGKWNTDCTCRARLPEIYKIARNGLSTPAVDSPGDEGAKVLEVDLGYCPKMNEDERQCVSCERVKHESEFPRGTVMNCWECRGFNVDGSPVTTTPAPTSACGTCGGTGSVTKHFNVNGGTGAGFHVGSCPDCAPKPEPQYDVGFRHGAKLADETWEKLEAERDEARAEVARLREAGTNLLAYRARTDLRLDDARERISRLEVVAEAARKMIVDRYDNGDPDRAAHKKAVREALDALET